MTDAQIGYISTGTVLLDAYFKTAECADNERGEDYLITDAITALLHLAHSRGIDTDSILRMAETHIEAETTKCEECGEEHDPDIACEDISI